MNKSSATFVQDDTPAHMAKATKQCKKTSWILSKKMSGQQIQLILTPLKTYVWSIIDKAAHRSDPKMMGGLKSTKVTASLVKYTTRGSKGANIARSMPQRLKNII